MNDKGSALAIRVKVSPVSQGGCIDYPRTRLHLLRNKPPPIVAKVSWFELIEHHSAASSCGDNNEQINQSNGSLLYESFVSIHCTI